jgi:uncharacterized protein
MTRPQPRASITPVLVDTGGYYALTAPEDPHHNEAVELIRGLARGRYRLYTTHLIISETHTLLRSRLKHRGRDYALSVARKAVAGIHQSSVRIELITAEDARQAVETLFAFPDQELSYTDATSFAVMRRLGISYVLAFDDDFAFAGFTNIRHAL